MERQFMQSPSDIIFIADRSTGTETWTYRDLFKLTSSNITPSNLPTSCGNANVALKIDGDTYNWLGLTARQDDNTGITTSLVEWDTVNPFGNAVTSQMYSAPASEVTVYKGYSKLAGYNEDEWYDVYAPSITFRNPSVTTEYRITAISSRFANEDMPAQSTLTVTGGTGNAIRLSDGGVVDDAYTGIGTSTFAGITTDAETMHRRVNGTATEYTMFNGTTITVNSSLVVNSDQTLYHMSMRKNANISMSVNAPSGGIVLINNTVAKMNTVYMDGAAYSGFTSNATSTLLTIAAGEHTYELYTNEAPAYPTADFTATPLLGTEPLSRHNAMPHRVHDSHVLIIEAEIPYLDGVGNAADQIMVRQSPARRSSTLATSPSPATPASRRPRTSPICTTQT
jgi:hypothetical protein